MDNIITTTWIHDGDEYGLAKVEEGGETLFMLMSRDVGGTDEDWEPDWDADVLEVLTEHLQHMLGTMNSVFSAIQTVAAVETAT